MFRFIAVLVCISLASAGVIPDYHGLHHASYSLPTLYDDHHLHHSAIALPAPTIVKYAEPIVLKSYAPLAESYSNVHKLSYKVPIHHHTPIVSLPSYHSSSISLPSYPYGDSLYGHGDSPYGHGHSLYVHGDSLYGHGHSLYGHAHAYGHWH